MNKKFKSAVYVISNKGLLVFQHSAHPEVGFQVPCGTVHVGEDPIDAAIRELEEETGLVADKSRLRLLRVIEHDMRPFKSEIQVRYTYLLLLSEDTLDSWVYWEMHPDTTGAKPEEFRFHWEPLHNELPSLLAVGQGNPIRHLCTANPFKPVQRLEYKKVQLAIHAVAAKRRDDLVRQICDLQPAYADRVQAASKQIPFVALLEHIACIAIDLFQTGCDTDPVFELLRASLDFSDEYPLLILDSESCFEVVVHDYETPLYLATEKSIKDACNLPISDWKNALSLLTSLNCMATVDGCLGIVVILGAKNLLEPTNSYTLSGVPGTVYCEQVDSRVRIAETLLHEATHTWLNYAFTALQPNGFSDQLYWSPWRQKKRPTYGILQATFVFSLLCQFFDRYIASSNVDPIGKAYAESRLRVESQVLRDNAFMLKMALEEVEDVALRALLSEDLNRALNIRPLSKEKTYE